MRLTCPECGTQYEVHDAAIPRHGREVQCSNCNHTWFYQRPSEQTSPRASEKPQPVETPQPGRVDLEESGDQPVQPPIPRPSLDPAVADILREEAKREQRARAADAIESQPDLGLDAAQTTATRRNVGTPGLEYVKAENPPPTQNLAQQDALAQLGDVTAFVKPAKPAGSNETPDPNSGPTARPRKGRFRVGFSLSVCLSILLALGYYFAPEIAEALPQTDPYVSQYVTYVDQLRVWLDGQVSHIAKMWAEWVQPAAR